ncbi:hypothetical protein G7Y89_g8579 [Cudoniella acicularis]|uniref:Uncharacterized protein n=1 Tax=Cudoniella acicularis TaxID=354080 RepID=A0A8H4W0X7_9HELO|nr:hypothetical protein G7Y89_g8579 [Cudoniella acicularis]
MSDTIYRDIHDKNFRSGIFRSSITRSMPPITSFNIPINSLHTTAAEKAIFTHARDAFARLEQSNPNGRGLAIAAMASTVGPMMKVTELFDNDARGRGSFVPKMTVQTFDNDGTVNQTHVVHDNGTATVTSGGLAGVPPRTSEELIRQREEQTRKYGEELRNGRNWIVGDFAAGTGSARTKANDASTPNQAAAQEQSTTTNNGNTATKKDDNDFGSGFSKNLRSTFM